MLVRDPKTARIGEEILPFEVGYLPEFFQKKAEIELHETPEKIVQCMRQLREMGKRDKRLKDFEVDDEFLLRYLRCRKFNVERAFSNIKMCFNFTRKYPENFVFKFEEVVKSIKSRVVTFSTWRCQDGCAVILVELENWKPHQFPLSEFKRMLVVLLFQALLDPMTQVNGFKVIFDVKITSIRLLRYCTPHNVWLLYHATQVSLVWLNNVALELHSGLLARVRGLSRRKDPGTIPRILNHGHMTRTTPELAPDAISIGVRTLDPDQI